MKLRALIQRGKAFNGKRMINVTEVERLKAENERLRTRMQEMSRDFAKVCRENKSMREEFERVQSEMEEASADELCPQCGKHT